MSTKNIIVKIAGPLLYLVKYFVIKSFENNRTNIAYDVLYGCMYVHIYQPGIIYFSPFPNLCSTNGCVIVVYAIY